MLLNFISFNESKDRLMELAVKAAEAVKSKSKNAADLVDDFICEFSQSKNSACEIWMDYKKQVKLAKDFASGVYDFKTAGYEGSRAKSKLEKKDWDIYDYEDNMGQIDVIYYRLKSKKLRNINSKVGVFENINEGMGVKGHPSHVLDAALLHYSTDTKTFSVEVSELGREFNPLYRNNDEIITILNTASGRSCDYIKSGEKRDAENELMYTIYTPPVSSSLARGTKLLVFND